MNELTEITRLSKKIGSDLFLVQGAGGNTSYKQDTKMWIKASGKWLANAEKEDIFVPVDLERIRYNITENNNDPLNQTILGETNLRPSIETTLHALMPHKVVVHTHPVELLSWLVREGGKELISDLLQGFSWAWVPYARPGITLTHAVHSVVENNEVDVLLLGNHGLVVGGENCDHSLQLMEKLLSCCKTIPRAPATQDEKIIEQLPQRTRMRLPKYDVIHTLALDKVSYEYCNNEGGGILYPDQAVFLGAVMPCYDEFIMKSDTLPLFMIIKDKGVLISNSASDDVDEILRCHAEVLLRIGSNKKLRYLTVDEVERLLDWEPEKYRQAQGK